MLRLLTSIICFFIFIGKSHAQCNYSLSGSVKDEHNDEPLPFALIAIEGSGKSTISDSLGNYQIKNVCEDKCECKIILHCDHMGCERIIDTLFITGNTIHNFRPEHHVNELGIINVPIEKREQEIGKLSHVVNKEELSSVKGKGLGEALQSVQGATNTSSGANVSKPTLRGMHSNRVLILNNEIRQEGQQWGTDHGVELDVFDASEINVIQGANSLQYGSDAIGGVVLLDPKSLRRKHGLEGEINAIGESNGKRAIINGRIDGNFKGLPQFSYRLNGTFKKGGNVQSPNYYIANTGMEELNYGWALGYQGTNMGLEFYYSDFNSTIGIFSGAHIGNLTDLQAAFNAEEPFVSSDFTYDLNRPYQEISHEKVKAKGFIFFGDSSKLEAIYGRQFNDRMEFDVHVEEGNEPDFRFKLTTHNADLKWSKKGKINWIVGSQNQYQKNTWDGRYFIPNYEKYSIGSYGISSYKINKYNNLEIGFRYDYINTLVYYWENNEIIKDDLKFQNLSANIGHDWEGKNGFVIKSNIASAWRPPSINELYSAGLHHGSAALEYGDKSIQKEVVYNGNINVQKKGKTFDFTFQGYINYFNNYIYLAPTGETELTIRGAFPVYNFKDIKASLNGIDAMAIFHLSKSIDFQLGVSLIRAKDLTHNKFLWGIPSDRYNSKLVFQPKSGKTFKNTYFSIGLQHVTQQTRFHIEDDFVEAPDAYTLLSADARTTLNNQYIPLTVFVKGTNLLNTQYRDYMNRFRYFTDELGTNIIFGVSIPFEIEEHHHHHK